MPHVRTALQAFAVGAVEHEEALAALALGIELAQGA
jgi:hypothetical protein